VCLSLPEFLPPDTEPVTVQAGVGRAEGCPQRGALLDLHGSHLGPENIGNHLEQAILLKQAQHIFQCFHPHHGIHVGLQRIRRRHDPAAGSVARVDLIEVDRKLSEKSSRR
jgi:hypothetical protein